MAPRMGKLHFHLPWLASPVLSRPLGTGLGNWTPSATADLPEASQTLWIQAGNAMPPLHQQASEAQPGPVVSGWGNCSQFQSWPTKGPLGPCVSVWGRCVPSYAAGLLGHTRPWSAQLGKLHPQVYGCQAGELHHVFHSTPSFMAGLSRASKSLV